MNTDKREWVRIAAVAALFLIIGAISFFWLSGLASSEENFPGTYAALDEKKTTVTELMGVTAASSTAITLIPGDAGTPIAEELADLSGYFMFILAAICLEKWMVTITGMLAFRILIPIACLVLIISRFIGSRKMDELGIKVILVALMMFSIIPASGVVTEKIDASYQASVQQTIEDTRSNTQQIHETVGDTEDEGVIQKLFDKVKGGVQGQIDRFENTLSRITEAVAVLIVTSCAIPIAVILFFFWVIRLLTGVSINIPQVRLSKVLPKK